MTVGEVCTYLQGRAPFETAEEYDNVGLLVGSPDMPACRILVTLDITPAAVRAAEEAGADLIVSHHPVIFSPLKRLDTGSIPYRLAGSGARRSPGPHGILPLLSASVSAHPSGCGRGPARSNVSRSAAARVEIFCSPS